MLTGKAIVKANKLPDGILPKFGNGTGIFDFDAPPIPANLMGQVIDFFTRIYDYQHTEAMVLLTMHMETKEWRIYVPTQRVSHGGIDYRFEPSSIRPPWLKVGSIHSHCDFGAGHSSTDTTDADGFNGLHMTTGFIKREIPQIVAMGSAHGKNFHYSQDSFPDLFDFSEVRQHRCPDWWFRYVEDPKEKLQPTGFELFEKYPKPKPTTITKVETKPNGKTKKDSPGKTSYNNYRDAWEDAGFVADDWDWNQQAMRMVHKTWHVYPNGDVRTSNGVIIRKGDWRGPTGATPSNHNSGWPPVKKSPSDTKGVTVIRNRRSRKNQNEKNDHLQRMYDGAARLSPEVQAWLDELSVAEIVELGFDWDGALKEWVFVGSDGERDELEEMAKKPKAKHYDDDFWEDKLGKELVNALFMGDMLSEDDIDFAIENQHMSGDKLFWRDLFLKKLAQTKVILEATGMKVNLDIKLPDPATGNAPIRPYELTK